MGLTESGMFNRIFRKKPVKIFMTGLDGVGTTTLLYKMKSENIVATTPTVGCNKETVEYNNTSFKVYDTRCGITRFDVWKRYLAHANGVIFVIDSSDRDSKHIRELRFEFFLTMRMPELKKCATLIFANKQDLPNSMSTTEITNVLEFDVLGKRKWHIQPVSAIEGNGLNEGLDWLLNELSNTKK